MKYRELTTEKLREELENLNSEFAELRFDLKAGMLADLKEYREMKKQIAQVLTVIRERDLGISKQEEAKEAATKKKSTNKAKTADKSEEKVKKTKANKEVKKEKEDKKDK